MADVLDFLNTVAITPPRGTFIPREQDEVLKQMTPAELAAYNSWYNSQPALHAVRPPPTNFIPRLQDDILKQMNPAELAAYNSWYNSQAALNPI